MNQTPISTAPLFSIITPVLNAGSTLADALGSVQQQDCKDFEHFVLDGLSSDDSLAVASRFPDVQVTSEADGGLYEAMNRGAQKAHGKWLIFLQADDWLEPHALSAFAQAAEKNPSAELITGAAHAVRWEHEHWTTQWKRDAVADMRLDVEGLALGEPMLNARAYSRSLWERAGGFDQSFSLASDRDFLLRLARMNLKTVEITTPIYRYRWHEGSRTMNAGNALANRLTKENLQIAENHLRGATLSEKKVLRRWHRKESIRLAMCALEAFQRNDFFYAVGQGFKVNANWGVFFFCEFMTSLSKMILRGGKTRSQVLQRQR